MGGPRDIVIPYYPRGPFLPYHMRKQRFAVLVAHRRAGKTVACINDLLRSAIMSKQPDSRYAYIAPFYNQAKDVAWIYLKRFAAPVLAAAPNESELRVDLVNGARIRLYGADNPDRLRGLYLDGVVLDEYADMHPGIWGEVLRPALADRQGWATFIGTPKGRNSFFELFARAEANAEWFSDRLPASLTGLLPQGELSALQAEMTPEQYAQELECSFDAAIVGAYFGREIAEAEREGRVTAVPHDPSLLVHTAWDIGVGDATAIWFFQVDGGSLRVIDHYESNGRGAQHFVQELNARREGLGYHYGVDFVPHDARQREWLSGSVPRQRLEVLQSLGRNIQVVAAHRVMDGINAARVTMARCLFDFERTRDGLEALRQYRAEFDEKTRAFADRPKHDWTSHTADAFRYLAMAWQVLKPTPRPKTTAEIMAELQRPQTLDEMMEEAGVI